MYLTALQAVRRPVRLTFKCLFKLTGLSQDTKGLQCWHRAPQAGIGPLQSDGTLRPTKGPLRQTEGSHADRKALRTTDDSLRPT